MEVLANAWSRFCVLSPTAAPACGMAEWKVLGNRCADTYHKESVERSLSIPVDSECTIPQISPPFRRVDPISWSIGNEGPQKIAQFPPCAHVHGVVRVEHLEHALSLSIPRSLHFPHLVLAPGPVNTRSLFFAWFKKMIPRLSSFFFACFKQIIDYLSDVSVLSFWPIFAPWRDRGQSCPLAGQE